MHSFQSTNGQAGEVGPMRWEESGEGGACLCPTEECWPSRPLQSNGRKKNSGNVCVKVKCLKL
jgi:hypothetical protein